MAAIGYRFHWEQDGRPRPTEAEARLWLRAALDGTRARLEAKVSKANGPGILGLPPVARPPWALTALAWAPAPVFRALRRGDGTEELVGEWEYTARALPGPPV